MREQVIDFIASNTSFTHKELESWTDKELDDFMGRAFVVEY
jgi:hypothetical protein